MKEEEFKVLQIKALRKAGLVNMAIKKKLSFKEALKINDITVEEFELVGWKYNKEKNEIHRIKYVSYSDITERFLEKQEIINRPEEINMGDNGIPLDNIFSNQNMKQLQSFFNNYEIIMQVVEMFKSNNRVDPKDNSIVIELPFEEDKLFKASYRINKTINQKFKEFCKEHKEFTSKDLISMALKEYIDNHS